MSDKDKAELKAMFPNGVPKWILDRDWSLEEAIDTMKLRQRAFPATN